ncbi:MAG: hypothetical protein WCV90_06715 [Candidatus Woesearchaeota archaeon]|jgi:Zn-dependent protease
MINKVIKIGKISTSRTELIDILKAWIVISLTFSFLFSGITLSSEEGFFSSLETGKFWITFLISLITVGIGFLFHELAHKFVAQHYGCVAEFRSFDEMLLLALGLAILIGFTFIAPGAVMISGMITRKENGIISVAGPATNYVLALIFLGLMLLIPSWSSVLSIGFSANLWLGLFNMIPFLNFDGVKIFRWNIPIWAGMVAFGIFFLFFFGRVF